MKPAPPDACCDLGSLAVLILCGGLGTRLRPVVSDRPKCLAPVGGRPFLEVLLDHLHSQGLRHFVLCAGYGAEAVASAGAALSRFGEIRLSREECALGTAGALRLALAQAETDPVLAMNGDSLAVLDLAAMLAFHHARSARATIALVPAPGHGSGRDAGAVELDANRRILSFREKPDAGRGGYLNAGVYLLAREVLQAVPPRRQVSLEREVFPQLLERGIFGFPCSGFYDIGTPERYALAPQELADLTGSESATPSTLGRRDS